MCNNCHQYFYKLSNFFLVLTILLSLYFLILYSSLYDDLDNSNKSLTNFFDEAINNLNYSEINISLLNSEDIIESNSDLNLTVEDLIFEKVSNKSDEFKKECDIFKGCFKATLAFTILNLLFDILMIITLNCNTIDYLKCPNFVCDCCYHIYIRSIQCAAKIWDSCSPLFMQFVFFLINIILIAIDLFVQRDKIKDLGLDFFEIINCDNCKNNYDFFDDLEKFNKYVYIYFIIILLFEALTFFYFFHFCCIVKVVLNKMRIAKEKEKEVQVKPCENNYSNKNIK